MNKLLNSAPINAVYRLQIRNSYNTVISYYWYSVLDRAGLLKVYKEELTLDKKAGIMTKQIFAKLTYKLDTLCEIPTYGGIL